MNNQQLLNNWLGDRRRKYADGVSLFRVLGRPQEKKRYLEYLEDGLGKVTHQFDGHFTLLINALARISRDIPLQPSLYPEAFKPAQVVVASVQKAAEPMNQAKISEKRTEKGENRSEIAEKRTKKGENRSEIAKIRTEIDKSVSDVQYDVSDLDDRVFSLEHEVRSQGDSIDELSDRVEDLSKPGVKVVTEASMPPSIRKVYDRIKEIVPLYARLHADISHADISNDERQKLAKQLCDLDDERRRLWGRIDAWSEGKKVELEAERPQYSEDPVVRGYEYARAVRRLKDNIRNSQKAADKAKKDGRTVVYENAMRRIEGYEQELMDIESKMSQS